MCPTPRPKGPPTGGLLSRSQGWTGPTTGPAQVTATADGDAIQQWSYLRGNNQRWLLVPVDDGFFKIVSESSGKVLEVTGGPTAVGDGVAIQQWSYVDQPNQPWQQSLVDCGTHRIVSRSRGKVLEVSGGPAASGGGAAIQQWGSLGAANQHWRLLPIDGPFDGWTAP